MITIDVVLLVVSFVSFVLATFNVAVPRVNLIALVGGLGSLDFDLRFLSC